MLRSGGNARSETFKAAMVQAKKMQAYCELKVIWLTISSRSMAETSSALIS
jgi:hypothetical protein